MRFILALILVILGFVYVPLNLLYLKIQKWYMPQWRKDKVVYIALAPFYWVFVAILSIISWFYEGLAKLLAAMH